MKPVNPPQTLPCAGVALAAGWERWLAGEELEVPARDLERLAIYVASMYRHVDQWRGLRAAGLPIVSRWIDRPFAAHNTEEQAETWRLAVEDLHRATCLIVWVEDGDRLQSAEIGGALVRGLPVAWVDVQPRNRAPQAMPLPARFRYSIANHPGVHVVTSLAEALAYVQQHASAPAPPGTGQTREDAWLAGFAFALAEMHRLLLAAREDSGLCRVARDAGLTLAEARRVGVAESDIERLQRAGVR